MKHLFLLLLALFSPLVNAQQHYHLVRIVATGSARYSSEDVARASGLNVNAQVTMDDLERAANRLANCGVFSSVQFLYKPVAGTRNGVEADFQVKDAQKFLPAWFENVIWIGDEELQRALHQALPLYAGLVPLNGTMPDDLSAALSKLLAARGLPSQVSYMVYAELGKPPSAYKYKIDNAGLKVSEVHVSGAARMPEGLLAKSLSRVPGTEYLRSDMMRMLQLSLEPLYRDHGFLKFKILEVRPSLKADGGVTLETSVDEGRQYRLAALSWSGNTLITADELSKRITLKAGEPVDEGKLARDLAHARKLFGKFGHEGTIITPEPVFAADTDTVTYVFTVKEGQVYRMGRLEIESFDAETTQKLAESWKLAPGTPYDNTYLQEFLIRTLPLAHGRQRDWVIFEQVDDAQKIVNVRLHLKDVRLPLKSD